MVSALAIAAGAACTAYFTGSIVALGRRAGGRPAPRARDARSGRPLRIRVDRRRQGRRRSDR